jgi:hypothetical protein
MAATKNLRTIIAAATSNSAAATTTGTAIDLTTKYGGLLTIKITNGATGPTVVASAYVYTSGDNSAFKLLTVLQSQSGNSVVSEFALEIPPGVMYLRVDVKDNTAQAVTCEAFLQELTTI